MELTTLFHKWTELGKFSSTGQIAAEFMAIVVYVDIPEDLCEAVGGKEDGEYQLHGSADACRQYQLQ